MRNATQALCIWRAVRLVGTSAHLVVGVLRFLEAQEVVGSHPEHSAARVAGVKESRHLATKLDAHRVGRAHGKVALVGSRPEQAVWVATAQVVLHWHVRRRWRWRRRRWRVVGRGRRGHGLHAFAHGLVLVVGSILVSRTPGAERPTAVPGVCRCLKSDGPARVDGASSPRLCIPRHPLRPGRVRPVVAWKRVRDQIEGDGLVSVDAANAAVVPPKAPAARLGARVARSCTSV